MSLNEIKKESQIAGKGHNATFAIAILLAHRRFLTETVDGHVPENGGTCNSAVCANYCPVWHFHLKRVNEDFFLGGMNLL
jgi:hypothetical protein